MESVATVTPRRLHELLLNVAVRRPVFVLGPPGIGKSAIVTQFAQDVGMDCVSLLGTQLAPEDVSGVPQLTGDGRSRFCPPELIARDEPYVLFCDELNGASPDVQKALYPVVHEKRVGSFRLHPDTVVIAAGNRMTDSAVVRQMSSALINRFWFVGLRVSASEWLDWAAANGINPLITEYIRERPDHLHHRPPKHEEPFSTPRAWHILSDALRGYSDPTDDDIRVLASGVLSPHHAGQFTGFAKLRRDRFRIGAILKGEASWPRDPGDRDVLYFLAQSLRAQLGHDLADGGSEPTTGQRDLAFQAKRAITELAEISAEVARLTVAPSEAGEELPAWFLVEVMRDVPRIASRRDGA